MKKKMTPEEKEQLQAMLDKQSMEQAEKEQEFLKHKMKMKTIKNLKDGSGAVSALLGGVAGAAAHHDMSLPTSGSRAKELERRKRKNRAGKGPGLRQMKLTEEEKRELEAKIRGNK